jgi:hypothetical protein
VHEGWASLVEVNTQLTILDVFEANEALDAIAAAQPAPKSG